MFVYRALILSLVLTTLNNLCFSQSSEIALGKPSEEGVDETKLLASAQRIEDDPRLSIFSLLVSKNGKLIFELYTGQIKPDESHYLMSVTKSVLSTLIGIAVDQGKIPSTTTPISELAPGELFKNKISIQEFQRVNLQNVMGMSALNTPDPRRDMSASSIERQNNYLKARNYLKFVLGQPLLKNVGTDFLYNDETASLASGVLSYKTQLSAFDYGCQTLFKELQFKNMEWMHQDLTGINMGGYGLRLRPIDMQKIGITILQKGKWEDKQVLSSQWVKTIFQPYISNAGGGAPPNYGWYWWHQNYGSGRAFLEASGWKGQRIAIQPDLGLVVTMTGCLEPKKFNEDAIFSEIIKDYIIPAAEGPSKPAPDNSIDELLQKINKGQARHNRAMESRMIPSVRPKERAIRFRP
jgi:CubicO group peptidase (beta-lactamase class C family)